MDGRRALPDIINELCFLYIDTKDWKDIKNKMYVDTEQAFYNKRWNWLTVAISIVLISIFVKGTISNLFHFYALHNKTYVIQMTKYSILLQHIHM